MIVAVLFFAGLASLVLVQLVAEMDRRAYRRHGGDLPTLASLPRYVCIPTAWRRR